MIRSGEPIINETNYHEFTDGVVDGQRMGRGLVPRNFKTCPYGSMEEARAVDFQLIPESEWDARYDEMVEQKSFLSNIRLKGDNGQPILSQNQGQEGFCWYYSTAGAIMVAGARDFQPHVYLSAHAGACMVKNYRNEGGWCGESLKHHIEHGCPSKEFWPLRSMSRSNDTPEMRANAALHKVTEGFYDLGSPIWDQKLTFQQLMTCLFLRIPCATDFNWWGHSVCALDPVRVERGSWGIRIWNSWSDSWGDRGMGVLQGNQARPDGAVAIRVSGGSVA